MVDILVPQEDYGAFATDEFSRYVAGRETEAEAERRARREALDADEGLRYRIPQAAEAETGSQPPESPLEPSPAAGVRTQPSQPSPVGERRQYSPYDDVFRRHAGDLGADDEFIAIVAAGTKAESGWDAGNKTGDRGKSWGLFQMHEGGAGAGLGEKRLDPDFASSVMVPRFAFHYRQGKALGLGGAQLASYVARMAERPLGYEEPAGNAARKYMDAWNQVTSGEAGPGAIKSAVAGAGEAIGGAFGEAGERAGGALGAFRDYVAGRLAESGREKVERGGLLTGDEPSPVDAFRQYVAGRMGEQGRREEGEPEREATLQPWDPGLSEDNPLDWFRNQLANQGPELSGLEKIARIAGGAGGAVGQRARDRLFETIGALKQFDQNARLNIGGESIGVGAVLEVLLDPTNLIPLGPPGKGAAARGAARLGEELETAGRVGRAAERYAGVGIGPGRPYFQPNEQRGARFRPPRDPRDLWESLPPEDQARFPELDPDRPGFRYPTVEELRAERTQPRLLEEAEQYPLFGGRPRRIGREPEAPLPEQESLFAPEEMRPTFGGTRYREGFEVPETAERPSPFEAAEEAERTRLRARTPAEEVEAAGGERLFEAPPPEYGPNLGNPARFLAQGRGANANIGRATTARGIDDPSRNYDFRYRLVSLGDLVTSQTDPYSLADNPAFPQELQPRARDRAASRLQIERMAREMVPEAHLDDVGALDRGPAIVGADGVVESGNGRILSLRLARDSYPEQFAAYRSGLRARAADYGLDPGAIDEIVDPVLVRERITPVDRAAFAREANQSTSLGMAPLEVAAVDAGRLSDRAVGALQVSESGSIDQALKSAANRSIVRSFIGALPENERAALLDAEGNLNLAGLARLKAALFMRTYPGEAGRRLAETFLESTDEVIRNIEHGLFSSLPAMGKAEALMRAGFRHSDLSIAKDLSKAVDMLARLKESGRTASDYLGQVAMFERELSPIQEQLLRRLDTLARAPRQVRELIEAYAGAVESSPHPEQAGMFGAARPTKEQLLERVLGERAQQEPSAPLFRPGEGAAASQEGEGLADIGGGVRAPEVPPLGPPGAATPPGTPPGRGVRAPREPPPPPPSPWRDIDIPPPSRGELMEGIGRIDLPSDMQAELRGVWEEFGQKPETIPWNETVNEIARRVRATPDELAARWRDQPRGALSSAIAIGKAGLAHYEREIAILNTKLEHGFLDAAGLARLDDLKHRETLLMLGVRREAGEIGRALNFLRLGTQVKMARLADIQYTQTGRIAKEARNGLVETSKNGKLDPRTARKLGSLLKVLGREVDGEAYDVDLLQRTVAEGEREVARRKLPKSITEPVPEGRAAPEFEPIRGATQPALLEAEARESVQDLAQELVRLNRQQNRARDVGNRSLVDEIERERQVLLGEIDTRVRQTVEESLRKPREPATMETADEQTARAIVSRIRANIKGELMGEGQFLASVERGMAKKIDRAVAKDAIDSINRLLRAAPGSADVRREADVLLRELSSVSNEAERAVGAYREMMGKRQLMKIFPGDPDAVTPELIEQFSRLDLTDPRAVPMAAELLGKPPSAWRQVAAVRVASMLFNTGTQIINTLGNALLTGYGPVARLAAAATEEVVTLGGRRRPQVAHASEAAAELAGLAGNWRQAIDEFATTMRTGVSTGYIRELGTRSTNVIRVPVLSNLNYVFRVMSAVDDAFTTLNTGATLTAEAERISRLRGVGRDEVLARIVDFPEALERAEREALRRTLRAPLGDIGRAVNALRGDFAIHTLVPFFNSLANIIRIGHDLSPLGATTRVLRIKDTLTRELGHAPTAEDMLVEAANARGDALIGTSLMGLGATLSAAGLITAGFPTESSERGAFIEAGRRPGAARFGDLWLSLWGLGPIAVPIFLGALGREAVEEGMKAGKWEAGASKFIEDYSRFFLDLSGLRGAQEFLSAIMDPEHRGERFLETTVTSFVPLSGALGQLTRVGDPTMRDPEGVWDAIMARLPGFSEQVGPRIDRWGEEKRREATGALALLPLAASVGRESADPVRQEVLRLEQKGYKVSPDYVGRTLTPTKGEPVRLTSEEWRSYQRVAGTMAHQTVEALMETTGWETLPDQIKADYIDAAVKQSRTYAQHLTKPELYPRASEQRVERYKHLERQRSEPSLPAFRPAAAR